MNIGSFDVGIDQYRKITAVLPGGNIKVFVQVTAQHQVDLRFVEQRDEQPFGFDRSVPGGVSGRNVDDYDTVSRIFAGVAVERLFEPLGLLGPVRVETAQTVVFYVAVGLVFTAVHYDKEDRTCLERIVGLSGGRRKIVAIVGEEQAPGLVVATGVEERNFRGKTFDGGSEEPVENLLAGSEGGHHVAVE